jgi:K+-sensing histidine kinase KdpD
MGLGLALCRAILAAHGGRIWMKNRREGGAVVRFVLPIKSEGTASILPHAIDAGAPNA